MPDARVRHFMTESVHTIRPYAPLGEAAAQMSDAGVSCLVVRQGDALLGVLTERDVTRAYARDVSAGKQASVKSAMSKGLWTLPANASCAEALELMSRQAIRRIVVVGEEGELQGVITQSDLLRAHAEEVEIQKEVLEQRVAQRTRELRELNLRLEGLARIDPLLGIGNRRAMDDELERLEQRAARYARPYSVALLDVDFFKKYNDRYGHDAGDDALMAVSRAIQSSIRAADAVYRYGGEEFLVVFPEIGLEGAAVATEHVRAAVAAERVRHEDSPFGCLTVSAGVAAESTTEPRSAAPISRADRALYAAKANGRNRVELARAAEAGDAAPTAARVA